MLGARTNLTHSFPFLFASLRYLQFESRVLPSIETLARLPKPNNFECGIGAGAGDSAASATVTTLDSATVTTTTTTVTTTTTTTPLNARHADAQLTLPTAVPRSGSLNTLHAGKSVVDEHDTTITCGNNGPCAGAHIVCRNVDSNASNSNIDIGIANALAHSTTTTTTFGKCNRSGSQPKLPSLPFASKITASLDNCKCFQ